jgi:hypothetical protein
MGRAREWFNRYALPEITSGFLSVFLATFTMYTTGNVIIAGYVGTLADNLSYYGIIVYRDLRKMHPKGKRIGFAEFMREMRNLLIEFGPAEYLDTIAIRPFFLILAPFFIPVYPIAIIVGGLLADFFFYIPTIFGYEFRKRTFKD